MSKHWLEETLQKSQERFLKQPQWLQERARSEDLNRRAEAHRLYGGSEKREGAGTATVKSGNQT